jgi:hypothetical protein
MEKVKCTLSGKWQRGSVIVIFALSLFILIGFATLAIDFGLFYTARSELQNVADAAALAGARYLGAEYVTLLDPSEMGSHSFTKEDVYKVIEGNIETGDVGIKNKVANEAISIDINDVEIGFWRVEENSDDVIPSYVGPDAVRVIARRDSNSINGPISTFFAQVFGIESMNVEEATAIAALTGPAFVEEGELKTPFGLSENVFPNDCKDIIAFSPTTDSCAAWHNFFDPIDANKMEDKLLGLIRGDDAEDHGKLPDGTPLSNGPEWLETNFEIFPDPEVTPSASSGDEFEFQGGKISSLFNGSYLDDYNGNTGTVHGSPTNKPAPIIALFDYFRYRDGDGDDTVWTATIPVYKDLDDGCMNPNNALEIVGFAKIVVMSPDPPPLSSIQVHVDCNLSVIEGRGGGGNYGNLKGTIPNLVK